MDPHNWDKADCCAPALSQAELGLLTTIAMQSKYKLESTDVSLVFCQLYLLKKEQYLSDHQMYVHSHLKECIGDLRRLSTV